MKTLLACVLILVSSNLVAEEHEESPQRACVENITMFQDVSMIGRKDRLASNITKRHREMNAQGWRFIDMEIYVENADIEGAFLSYERDVPCPAPGDN